MTDINWQDIYYVVATLSMVVVMITFIWIMRVLFSISKLLSSLVLTTQKLGNGVDDIKKLGKDITLKILRKISNMLDKGGEYEQ